jgi:hypothetical protein
MWILDYLHFEPNELVELYKAVRPREHETSSNRRPRSADVQRCEARLDATEFSVPYGKPEKRLLDSIS